nr:MAG TPA: hypothetical protein [Caudoviricetes sp.]
MVACRQNLIMPARHSKRLLNTPCRVHHFL